jgi:ATP-dependent DNA helicase PIF1
MVHLHRLWVPDSYTPPLWNELQILKLKKGMFLYGVTDDKIKFVKWQIEVGHGKLTDDNGNVTLPGCFHSTQNTVESLIDTIYPDIGNPVLKPDTFYSERAILSARNDDVDSLNKEVLEMFSGDGKVYHSANSIVAHEGIDGAEVMYPVEYLNSINVSGLPVSKLTLKVGCPVMILCNLNPVDGVCNGSRGIITWMSNCVVEVWLIGGQNDGHKEFIPRIGMIPSNSLIAFKLTRLQLPLQLGFCMTINKSQGQSLHQVGLDFRSPVFTHGQFYIAI